MAFFQLYPEGVRITLFIQFNHIHLILLILISAIYFSNPKAHSRPHVLTILKVFERFLNKTKKRAHMQIFYFCTYAKFLKKKIVFSEKKFATGLVFERFLKKLTRQSLHKKEAKWKSNFFIEEISSDINNPLTPLLLMADYSLRKLAAHQQPITPLMQPILWKLTKISNPNHVYEIEGDLMLDTVPHTAIAQESSLKLKSLLKLKSKIGRNQVSIVVFITIRPRPNTIAESGE
ncbi:hypothetical protein LXL04_037851 [Taraxacum kok-saghyz]